MDLFLIDKKAFFMINQGLAAPLLDGIMLFLTRRGYLLIFPFFLYVLGKEYRDPLKRSDFDSAKVIWTAAISFFSFLLSDWCGNEIKHAFMRVRPCNALEGVRLLVGCTQSGSLPSNHAANSFAYAVPLFLLTRKRISLPVRLYPLMLASLVALSRVYVGVHYPSDVIAGAALGTTIALLLIVLYRLAGRYYRTNPEITLLSAGLIAISIFRIYYILHGPLDLSPDEAHYWEWSRRLDLSYYSKGPMIAYLIYLGTSLLGDTVLGIRIMAVICSALSSIFLFKLVTLMYRATPKRQDNQIPERLSTEGYFGLISAFSFQAIPLFAAFGVLFSIDSPFTFFWILSLYFFYKATAKEKHQWTDWILLGFSIGLGLLTKYTMALFIVCGFLTLLFSEKRPCLKTLKPYAALAISMLVFSPVIVWNAQHNWVTIRHTAGQAHVADGLTFSVTSFLNFFGSQVGVITPLLFCLMFFALFQLFFSDRRFQTRFLFYFSIPVIGFFLLKALQGKVQANWAMISYITGIIAAVYYSLTFRTRARAVFFTCSISLALIVTVISHYPSLIRLPYKLDPSMRLRGWKGLGQEVSRLTEEAGGKQFFLLFSDSYQITSELAFYVKDHPETFSINLGRRMNQYDFWPDMNDKAAKLRQQTRTVAGAAINGIFVRSGDADMPNTVAQAFERSEKKVFQIVEHGIVAREYSIFICYNFKYLNTEKPQSY